MGAFSQTLSELGWGIHRLEVSSQAPKHPVRTGDRGLMLPDQREERAPGYENGKRGVVIQA